MLNNVAMVGRLVKDAEVEPVGKENEKARITLACERDYKDRDGNKVTDFIDCEVWNAGARFLESYAHKGDLISVSGRVQKDTWKDRDGNWQSRTYIAATAVNILSTGNKGQDEQDQEEKPAKNNRRRK